MKYWILKGEFWFAPVTAKFHNYDWRGFGLKHIPAEHNLLVHQCGKPWANEKSIKELLNFAKSKFPDFDFSETEKHCFRKLLLKMSPSDN